MAYAAPPPSGPAHPSWPHGPHGPAGAYAPPGLAAQAWYGADPRQAPAPVGPVAPRKGLVILVGLLLTAAVLSVIAFYVLWAHHASEQVGDVTPDSTKDLPGPRALGVSAPRVPGTAAFAGGNVVAGAAA